MKFNNAIHQSIYRHVVKPIMDKQQATIDGYVIRIDYTKQVADVAYFDQDSSVQRIKKDVILPKDADGVFRQAVKNGDRVTVSFKNSSHELPYVSVVYRGDASSEDYVSPYGGRTVRQTRLL
jgi:hypothetical protein